MWTDGSTPYPTRRRAEAGAAFSAVCSDDGDPDLPPAAGVWPGDFAGGGGGSAVRCAAPLPLAPSQSGRSAGCRILPHDRRRGLFVPAASGRGRAAGIYGAGSHRRRGGVFLRTFPIPAPGVGFLGGYLGGTGTDCIGAAAMDAENMHKIQSTCKKSLLF